VSDSITLALNGAPTLDDLSSAVGSLRGLLSALTGAVANGERIDWVVDALEVGSAVLSFRGTAARTQAVEDVASAYLDVGRSLARGTRVPDPAVMRAAEDMIRIIDERVDSIRFETADDDVTVGATLSPTVEPPSAIPGAYGAVLGRVQTISSRNSLRFTLFDLLHNKAVFCYLRADQQDLMRNAWDRVALVRGWIKRDAATGRPVLVRRVRSIELRPEGGVDSWREAAGALNTPDEEWTAVVRRLRDAR
jgi:hypothetical protein